MDRTRSQDDAGAMNDSFGQALTIALVCVFGVSGAILTFNPRMIRRLVAGLYGKRGVPNEFTMPGALLSVRVIGAACLALAFVIATAARGILNLF